MLYSFTLSHCFSVNTVLFPQPHSDATLCQTTGQTCRQSHLQTIQPQISHDSIKMCLWQQNSVKRKAMDQNNNDNANCCVHNSPGDAWTEWSQWWQPENYVQLRGHHYYTAKPAVQIVRGKLMPKHNGLMEGPVMENMAKDLKGSAVSCGQRSSFYLADVPELWQIHKDETALMHKHRPALPYCNGSTCDPLFLQISNTNTDSWSAGTKTCTYDQHMQKTPPKNTVCNKSPPSPNRFSLSSLPTPNRYSSSTPKSQQIFLKFPPKSQQIFLKSPQVPTDISYVPQVPTDFS